MIPASDEAEGIASDAIAWRRDEVLPDRDPCLTAVARRCMQVTHGWLGMAKWVRIGSVIGGETRGIDEFRRDAKLQSARGNRASGVMSFQ